MWVIGIAGGVASGKSLVSRKLNQLGAALVDADSVGHEVLREDHICRAIHDRWGDEVLAADGSVDRGAVARIVFGNCEGESDAELKFLEELTFPLISQRIGERLGRFSDDGVWTAVVLDAAVMFKAGWDRYCDRIIFVDAPLEQRLARALGRGWTRQQFESREAVQLPLAVKRNGSDIVIDNSGSIGETESQTERFWQSLDKIPPSPPRHS